MTTNHYAVMGIQDFARGSEAKRAYHRLALLWHPDRQVHAPEHHRKEAEDIFKKINEAYAVLSDNVRRNEFDLILRGELFGMNTTTSAKAGPRDAHHAKRPGSGNISEGEATRQIMCPECGTSEEVQAGKKGGPSLQCRECEAFFHEVYCAGCKEWGATRGRRGESTMRCGCGNVFCQSRCPSCCRWNTFHKEAQGGRTRSCGSCGCKFHEAFCPGCSSWGVWEGKKGCRTLSCDCTSLFYEISCQSCGMWGSVKGRHADANNSLSCGMCGSESHEAFCPTCRQWDSYAGAKGESTLICKNPQCRTSTTKFFQVYCESCACWRSVLGDKNAVGTANIRCEGCMSNFLGNTCPACGNWDQLLRQNQREQRVGERLTRLRPKHSSEQKEISDLCHAESQEQRGNRSQSIPPQCTSCGHQAPPSPDDGGLEAEALSSYINDLTGIAHGGAGAVASGAAAVVVAAAPAAAAVPPNSAAVAETADQMSATAPTTTGLRAVGTRNGKRRQLADATEIDTLIEPPPSNRDGPILRDSKPAQLWRERESSPPSIRTASDSARGKDGKEHKAGWDGDGKGAESPQALTPATIHGTNSSPRPHRDRPRRQQTSEDAFLLTHCSLASNETVNCTSVQLPGKQPEKTARGGSSFADEETGLGKTHDEQEAQEAEGDEHAASISCADNRVPPPTAPAPTGAGQPPPRPRQRKRGGRRPFVPCRPAAPPSSASSQQEPWAARAHEPAAAAMPLAKEGGREQGVAAAEVLSMASTDAADGSPEVHAPPYDSGGAAVYRRSDRDRSSDRIKDGKRRIRRKRREQNRLGILSPSMTTSSLSSASAKTTATTETSTSIAAAEKGWPTGAPSSARAEAADGREGWDGKTAHSTPNHRVATDAARSEPTTFTAVPRERSPPPPPGIRVGGKVHKHDGDYGPGAHLQDSGCSPARGEMGPGRSQVVRGQGQSQVMVHLAYCSRCQGYQSWRAPLRGGGGVWRGKKEAQGSGVGGGGGGRGMNSHARRNCTECGELYCNVSYYPAK